jgi:UDP-2,3-diacylglucosamine hydrolase
MSERGGATPPVFFELVAGPHWQAIEFISDLHLSEHTPGTFRAFEHHLLNTDAQAVLLLGDLFEVWVGDDAADSGFELRCAQLLQAAAHRLHCAFMAGNRDFLLGPDLLQRCGVQELPDPTVLVAFGTRTLLSHGDALCLGDVDYQRFRAMVRTPQWRADFLAQPLAARREQARRLRDASEARKRGSSPQDYADVDATLALQWLRAAAAPVLVHGHTHRPASGPLGLSTAHHERPKAGRSRPSPVGIQQSGEATFAGEPMGFHHFAPTPDGEGQQGQAGAALRHVLSDWDLEDPSRPRAEVLRLTARGFERRSLDRLPDDRPGVPP